MNLEKLKKAEVVDGQTIEGPDLCNGVGEGVGSEITVKIISEGVSVSIVSHNADYFARAVRMIDAIVGNVKE